MKVYIERSNENKTLDFSGNAEELCDELGVNPQTVLIIKDGELITEDIDVTNAETIKLITVVSGG